MFTSLLVRLHLALVATFALVTSGARGRVSTARGANFVEYAILASVAVVIGYFFRSQLSSAFEGIIGTVTDGLDGQA